MYILPWGSIHYIITFVIYVVYIFEYSVVLMLRNDVNGSNSYFFNRPWSEFEHPFGDPDSLYWVGLERLNQLTTGHDCKIRFDLKDADTGLEYFAIYSNFSVGNSSSYYTMTVDSVQSGGNATDAFTICSGMAFSTYDAVHGLMYNMPVESGGGFWYPETMVFGLAAQVTGSPKKNYVWVSRGQSTIIMKLDAVQAVFVCLDWITWNAILMFSCYYVSHGHRYPSGLQ